MNIKLSILYFHFIFCSCFMYGSQQNMSGQQQLLQFQQSGMPLSTVQLVPLGRASDFQIAGQQALVENAMVVSIVYLTQLQQDQQELQQLRSQYVLLKEHCQQLTKHRNTADANVAMMQSDMAKVQKENQRLRECLQVSEARCQ